MQGIADLRTVSTGSHPPSAPAHHPHGGLEGIKQLHFTSEATEGKAGLQRRRLRPFVFNYSTF